MEKNLDLLRTYWKSNAFRPLQRSVIEKHLEGKDTLVLMPTGGGKSVCYQLPALLREGQTLVISPLISLMQDQVDQLNKRGIKAMFFEPGGGKNDIYRQLDNARNGGFKLIYCSPERLTQQDFISNLKELPIEGIAVDEAHCISEWGHDFRPSFRAIKQLKKYFPKAPYMALTASATPRVLEDIQSALEMEHAEIFSSSFERKNIRYQVQYTEDKMGTLRKIISTTPGESCIIYCRSRSKAENTAKTLQNWGLKASYYHGGLEAGQKKQHLEDWKNEINPIMVATNAFGMGIDKSNVRKVIHLIMPESMESYYQETGRAGRDGLPSYGILLVHPSDSQRLFEQFLSHLPDSNDIKKFYKQLCNHLHIAYGEGEGITHKLNFKKFCSAYGLPPKKTHHCMQILDREGVFEMQETFETQTHLKISCHQLDAVKRSEQENASGRILRFVMRNYQEIFRKEKKINMGQMVDLLGMDFPKIKKNLKLLQQENIIEYHQLESDIKLYWKVPREDQYTLNPFLKRIKAHHRLKADKINTMLDYAFEKTACKRNKILRYFGEKRSAPCDKCSAKSCEKNKRPGQDVEIKIKEVLNKEALSAYEIGMQMETSNEYIVIALHKMMEESVIGLDEKNKFYLK